MDCRLIYHLKKLLFLPAKVWLEGCINNGLTSPTSGPCSKIKNKMVICHQKIARILIIHFNNSNNNNSNVVANCVYHVRLKQAIF